MSSSNIKLAPWYTRRRTRSVGSAPFAWPHGRTLCANSTLSDDICSSSTSKDKDCSYFYQSDSDDICGSIRHDVTYDAATSTIAFAGSGIGHTLESDSFNENSPCRRSTRRKRKYKKIAAMDVDAAVVPVNRFYHPCSSASLSHTKKKRIMRLSSSCIHNGRLWTSSGKRKRSLREKSRLSLDGSGLGVFGGSSESSSVSRDAKVLGISKLSLNDYPEHVEEVEEEEEEEEERYDSMEVSYPIAALSCSSVSSSGSETGIFTNDEGREGNDGDDEQSDWIGDVGLGIPATGLGPRNVNEDEVEEDEEEDMVSSYRVGNENRMSGGDDDDESNCRIARPCPSKIAAANFFLPCKPPGNDCANRSARRKIRSLKMPPQTIQMLRPNAAAVTAATAAVVTEFQNRDSDFGNEMKVPTTSRRHTFSSYKRRKRIPAQTALSVINVATVSEKASPLFLASGQKLSDISSSDSKDSTL